MFVLGTIWFYFVVKMGRCHDGQLGAVHEAEGEEPLHSPPPNDATGLYKSNVITLLLKNMRKL